MHRLLPPSRRALIARDYLRFLLPDREIVVPTTGGFLMSVSPRDYVSHGIFFTGEYDAAMSTVLRAHVFPGDTAWDVGTERGWFSLLLGKLVGPAGRVDAFEALPATCSKLKANLDLNGMRWVNVNQVAVSDRSGTAWFVPPDAEGLTRAMGSPPLNGGIGHVSPQPTERSLVVPTISLDEYSERIALTSLAVIKMDIEGAEPAALRGAHRTIERHRPVLAIEYNEVALRRAGSSAREMDQLVADLGYRRFTWSQGFSPLTPETLASLPTDAIMFNVYCFPRECGNPTR